MRTYRKLQANVYGKDQTNSWKGQERELANRSFRTQGIEAEINFFEFCGGKAKEKKSLDSTISI
jgi:hypothetical protein